MATPLTVSTQMPLRARRRVDIRRIDFNMGDVPLTKEVSARFWRLFSVG
jgi:hypothetical protein